MRAYFEAPYTRHRCWFGGRVMKLHPSIRRFVRIIDLTIPHRFACPLYSTQWAQWARRLGGLVGCIALPSAERRKGEGSIDPVMPEFGMHLYLSSSCMKKERYGPNFSHVSLRHLSLPSFSANSHCHHSHLYPMLPMVDQPTTN